VGVGIKGSNFVTLANHGKFGKAVIGTGTTAVGVAGVAEGGISIFEGDYMKGIAQISLGSANIASGVDTFRFGPAGKVDAPNEAWGFGPYGVKMEGSTMNWISRRFRNTEFEFAHSPHRGPDVRVIDGDFPGFNLGEIKPNTYSGLDKYNRQKIKWDTPGVQPFTFDHAGNIYTHFGAPWGGVNSIHIPAEPVTTPSIIVPPVLLPTTRPTTRPSGG
jgi:hypothetical protein